MWKYDNELNEGTSQEQVIDRSIWKGAMHLTLVKEHFPNIVLTEFSESRRTLVSLLWAPLGMHSGRKEVVRTGLTLLEADYSGVPSMML